MFNIRVETVLNKNIDAVFDAISDHESYHRFPGVDRSVLIEQGEAEKNGKGALRQIVSGRIQLFERITDFERPGLMGYRIERSTPVGMRHDLGEIRLTPEGDGTRVVWVSDGHVKVPLLGNLIIDKQMEKQVARQFGVMLKMIEAE